MSQKKYPSSVTRKQFDLIRDILESNKKKTKPRKVDLYDVFNGILYLLKAGCQWDMLPSEFPDHKLCHYYFTEWKKEKNNEGSVLDRSLKKINWKGPTKQWSEREHKLHYC